MFYKILKINEIEYSIAVNITGVGEPFVSGAVPGMIYFDEVNEVAYIYTSNGSWKILIGPDVEIDPSCVTKAGVYAIKAVRENNNTSTEIHVNYLDENGEIDDYTSVFVMGVEGNFEETHIFVLTEDKPYGISIESAATCTMYAHVELAMGMIEVVADEAKAVAYRTSLEVGYAWDSDSVGTEFNIHKKGTYHIRVVFGEDEGNYVEFHTKSEIEEENYDILIEDFDQKGGVFETELELEEGTYWFDGHGQYWSVTILDSLSATAKEALATAEEAKKLVEDMGDLPNCEFVGEGEEVNKIVTAAEVFTWEELITHPSDAILKGYRLKGNNAYEVNAEYNTIKVICSEGDVLRSKLAPHWYHSSVTTNAFVCSFHNSNGTKLSQYNVNFADTTDLIANGIVAPANTAYALIVVYKYYFTEPTEDDTKRGDNGLTCDVVTLNEDASHTHYDKNGVLPDYVCGEEAYYRFTDDVRIERYEVLKETVGDIEAILEAVVGGVE